MKDYTLWKPLTKISDDQEEWKIKSAKGIYLNLDNGKKLIDCISSWWVNTMGHGNEEIARAIGDQARKLEHATYADFSHDQAEQLVSRVGGLLDNKLSNFFFSDDGSTAVEVALKIAFQYWKNRGVTRPKFLAFEGAFHGDTFGSMSVGSRGLFHQAYSDLFFEVDYIPYPNTWLGDKRVEEKEKEALHAIEKRLEDSPGRYAAIIMEPLVQGANGMSICREKFLSDLHELLDSYDILSIYDEVFTGFGRTGEWFACRKAKTQPDLVSLSKSITGGFLPLGLTACTDRIYNAFISEDPGKTFWHGHTYTGNPIACAAANKNLELLMEDPALFRDFEQRHLDRIGLLREHEVIVKNIRVKGSVMAFDIETDREGGYLSEIGPFIKKKAFESGLYLRPLGNVCYLVLPYIITDAELDTVYEKIEGVVEAVKERADKRV